MVKKLASFQCFDPSVLFCSPKLLNCDPEKYNFDLEIPNFNSKAQ